MKVRELITKLQGLDQKIFEIIRKYR